VAMNQPLNVLIIEDQEDDALLILRELCQSGFDPIWKRVETATDLQVALQTSCWDVIISDYKLPGFDAPSALAMVKQDYPNVPFIVVSGTIGDLAAVALMRAGAHDYLMKDNLARLPEAVRRELREAQTRLENKQALQTLDATQERLQLAVEGSGIGLWDWLVSTKTEVMNERCAEMIGYSLEELKPIGIEHWKIHVHPEDYAQSMALIHQYLQHATPSYRCELRMRHRAGYWIWVLDQGKVVEWDAEGKPLRMIGTQMDITDRKRAELRLALQNNILERIAKSDPLSDTLEALVLGVEQQLGDGICSILLCNNRTGTLHTGAAPNLPTAYKQALDGLVMGENAGSCGTAAFCQEVVVSSDIATDPRWENYRELALAHGLRSCWSAPAIAQTGTVLATLAVYYPDCRTPQPQDLKTITLAAEIAKIAIEQEQATQALAQLNQTLEDRVKRRTDDLKKSEEKLNAILNFAPAIVYVKDLEGRHTFVNQAFLTLFNCTTADIIGKSNSDFFNASVAKILDSNDQVILTTGNFQQYEEDLIVGDRVLTFLSNKFLLFDPDGKPYALCGISTDVSQKKADREALKHREEQSRGTLLAIPDLLFRLTSQGRYLDIVPSKRVRNLADPQVAIGKHICDLLPPDLVRVYQRLLHQAITTQNVQSEEYEVWINGQQHFEEVRVAPCGSHEAIFLVRDISETKAAQAALRQKEAYIQRIAANVPGAIYQFVLHQDGTREFIYVSDRAQTIVELDPDSIKGDASSLLSLIHPEDVAALKEAIAQSAATLQPWSWEGRLITPSGEQKWVQSIAQPECQANGNILWDGLILDISDRIQANEQLQESEEKYRNLVENANDIIYTLSAEGIFTYVSSNWTEILGHAVDEVVNQSFALFVHPDDAQKCFDFLNQLLTSGLKAGGIEYRVRHKNGEWRWHTSNASPQWDKSGAIVSILGIAHDITNRKKTEDLLHRSNAQLARATRLKDEFLANMSHELRTPLNAILGMSEGLQDEVFGTLNVRQTKAIATVERSGKHLLELINDILDLSKIEAGKLELKIDEVSIQSLCNTSLTFIRQTALKKQISLTTDIPSDLHQFKIQLDSRRICQVLINLLSNAVKFTLEGGHVCLKVRLEKAAPREGLKAMATSQTICFSIIDTGIGIVPEDLGKIFHSFVQIDSSLNRQYEGTGLGLALVKQLTEMHGGTVNVTSAVGHGSCFTVQIPCLPAPSLPHDLPPFAPVEEAFATAPQTLTQHPLILLAEDNEANILTIASYLHAKQYQLLFARDGHEAIALTHSHHPHLILMDIQMPGIDGLEAIRQIRQAPQFATTPIIALTALAMTGDRERSLEAGANDYLTKPVRLKHLVATIQQHLSIRNFN